MKLDELNKKLLSDEEVSALKMKFFRASESLKNLGHTNDELEKRQAVNSDNISIIRGNIISGMAELEQMLCMFLSKYFGKDKSSDFYKHILAQDFFTTHQKIKLFQRIGYHKQDKYNGKYGGLSGMMFKLNELRNVVAHGMKFHFTRPEIGYPYSGEIVHFDEDLGKTFTNAYEQVWFSLWLLTEDLDKEIFKQQFGEDLDKIIPDY
jgi:hypothetical protein